MRGGFGRGEVSLNAGEQVQAALEVEQHPVQDGGELGQIAFALDQVDEFEQRVLAGAIEEEDLALWLVSGGDVVVHPVLQLQKRLARLRDCL